MKKKHRYKNIINLIFLFCFLLNFNEIIGADQYSIDTSKGVSDIPYQITATPQGVLIYTIPIECSQSPSGFQPSLSLAYNSMSGMGVAGVGWSIGGLSAIGRVNQTIYYDGKVAPATLSDTCAFTLDGIRLVKKKDSNLLVSEQGNIQVKKIIQESGWLLFEVYYPNGNKATYRKVPSQISAANDIDTSYPITHMEDRFGNWINYSYKVFEKMYYVDNISYGPKGKKAIGEIYFSYDKIDPTFPKYFYGEKIVQSNLLSRIQVRSSPSDFFYNLHLSYKHVENKGIHFLERMEKQSGTSTEFVLNPLIFKYGSDKEEDKMEVTKKELTNFPEEIDSTMLIIPTKFSSKNPTNGLIFMPSKNTYYTGKGTSSNGHLWFLGKSLYTVKDTAYIYNNIIDQKELPAKINLGGGGHYEGFVRGLMTLDYEGKGESKILKISEQVRDYKEKLSKHFFEFYNSSGVKTDSFKTVIGEEYVYVEKPFKIFASLPKSYLIGDFTGMGYESLMYISHNVDANGNKHTSKAVLIDFKQKKVLCELESFSLDPNDILSVIDFDGDGKNEIVHLTKDGGFVYKFDLDKGFQKMASHPWASRPGEHNDKPNCAYFFADMNGDGKTDIIRTPIANSSEKHWTYFYSNGKDELIHERYEDSSGQPEEITSYVTENKYTLIDVDGNGLPDLVILDEKGNLSYHKNLKGKFSSDVITISEKIDPRSKMLISRIREANKLYPIMGIQHKEIALISSSVNQQENNLISSSVNSYGVETTYSYGTLTNKDVCSISGDENLEYPYNYFVEDMYVLNNIESKYKNDKITSKTYKYDSPVLHRQGLGFRGFEKILITDNIRNESSTTIFNPLKWGIQTNIESPTMQVASEYDTLFFENKRVQVLLTREIQKDKLKGTTTTSVSKYDTYGNLIEQSVDLGDGIKSSTSYQLENIDNDDMYLLGLVKEATKTNIRNKKTSLSKSIVEYNSSFLPKSKKSYYDDHLVSEDAFKYDDFYNLIQVNSKSYSSSNWQTINYEYDDIGRKIKEIDALGLYCEYLYEGKSRLQAIKNHKGHITRYSYDPWGRNTLTTYSDGTTKTLDFKWDSSIPNALYSTLIKATGSPDEVTYYDALGREIRSGSQRFDGSFLYVDQKYDEKGRVEGISLPFKGSNPSLWNVNSYDNYDRPTFVTYASGKKDEFHYGKLKTMSIIDGITTLKETDAIGQTIRIEDASGEIIYNLRADGQPESIVAPGDIETSFDYDKYGRQTAIHDPSAGTKTFVYDNNGNIQKETDARGKSISYVYDNFNRLLTSDIQDQFTTNYTYNTDNLLTKESSTNGTSIEYTYDEYFRPTTQKESIVDGKWLESIVKYRPDGNVGSIKYTSQLGNLATENYEYVNGIHTELKINNTQSIWRLTAENDMGMPTQSHTGVVERSYEYDQYGLPERRALSVDNKYIQDFEYKFEALTGNLKWRKDNTRDITENFSYDILNRLTSFGDNTVEYDKKGNITQHSQIGVFTYSKAKPYAIEKVAPYGEDIPMRKQKISYNTQMRPDSISENGYLTLLSYNSAGDRMKMGIKKNDQDFLRRYYIGGNYELDEVSGKTTERLYLGDDAYTASAVLIKEGNSSVVNYIGRDYLGSITHVIDATGVVIDELSYDAWGRLRDPKTQKVYSFDTEVYPVLGWRGYTGHEHLTMFGLINMNARLYDPVVGRFLSPDPYVQVPNLSQNYNRYSYVLNNPLRYNDLTGEWFGLDDLAAALIGGVVNLGVNIWQGNITGTPWEIIGKGAASFGAGAVAGNLALYGPVGWAAGGVIVGGTNSALSGGNAGEIIQSSCIGGLSGVAGGFAGQYATTTISPIVVNGLRITSPVIKGGVGGLLGGAGAGYSGSFTAGLIFSKGNFSEAHKQGMSGMTSGAIVGSLSGTALGYKYARDHDLNLWNGKWNGKISGNSEFRPTVENLTEQFTLKEAKAGAGSEIMKGEIRDPNWQGWQKMEHIHKTDVLSTRTVNEVLEYYRKPQTTIIHYWRNPITGETTGFKFK